MWTLFLHFLKREAETLFIHRFSLATMPARNIFKNSGHYWLLGGLNIAYFVYSPTSPTAQSLSALVTYLGLTLYALGELANLSTHLTLRGLRSAGGTERGIPNGLGFAWVTCPNYMFEILAWVGMWVLSGFNWSVLFFIVVAGAQMVSWAGKKERRYRQEFGDKYKKKRFAMIPGLI
jgi:very-long-chain enoyl-CoA reductase